MACNINIIDTTIFLKDIPVSCRLKTGRKMAGHRARLQKEISESLLLLILKELGPKDADHKRVHESQGQWSCTQRGREAL